MKNLRFPIKNSGKELLLLINAILCFCYAICYLLLAVLPAISDSFKKNIHAGALALLHILFLLVLTLNINTISVLYLHIARPDKTRMRNVYRLTIYAWLVHIVTACCFTFFMPLCSQHFNHKICMTFQSMEWPTFITALIFAYGLCMLFTEYYKQAKMQHLLVFIIPAVLQFSFKLMLPFLFFTMSWLLFGGCHLLLYFSIVDSKRFATGLKKEFPIRGYANQ